MKYVLFAGIFLLGLSLGYLAGTRSVENSLTSETGEISSSDLDDTDSHDSDNDSVDEDDHDLTADNDRDFDSTTILSQDSLLAELMLNDSLSQEDNISTEKLIKSANLPIFYLAEESSGDSTMQDLLGIEEVKNTAVFVEFWESPLNFEGYKLSRKKLVVYGLSPQFDYKLYKDENDYYLSYQNVFYKMKETQDFLPFTEVSRSEVFHD